MRTPSKREAVIAVLAESAEPMSVAHIRAVRQHRGWLPADPKAANALHMTLSTLNREQKIERVTFGTYRLRQNSQVTPW